MYFWTYILQNTCLDKSLKSPVSEDPSTSNMVNRPKHSWRLYDSTFTIFIDTCECNWGLKCYYELYAKSYDCLLTYWQPITSIFFLIETICSSIFRGNYLRNWQCFLNFFPFSKFRLNFEHFQKKDEPHSLHVFSNLRNRKNVVKWVSKNVPFQRTFPQVTW